MKQLPCVLALISLFALTAACDDPPSITDARAPSDPDSSRITICEPHEPGERLTIRGRVLDDRGMPLSKAAVIAYNADRNGLYNPPDSPTRVPRIRGVAVSADDGSFRVTTVRPGAYPSGTDPAHLHLEVVAPAHHLRSMEIWFEGDPLITAEHRRRAAASPNTVLVELSRAPSGAWEFSRDIRLQGN
ncbi:MAG: hypothetical protein FJ253_06605 [Phycisphaerae bacterium]|nr:hypothetical protein [Phycisphaerae bacterium]